MLFRDLENWANPTAFVGLLFFAQRLDELTFEYTLDSYKAPTTNAPFLVRECIRQLEECEKNGIPIKSAFHILDELENRLQDNIIAKSLTSLKIDNYIGRSRDNIDDIKRRLHVLQREIAPRVYALKAMEIITSLAKTKKKKELNFLSREIASTLIGLGVSPFHINDTVNKIFFSKNSVADESTLDEFFREVYPHAHKFTVCFKIRTNINLLDDKVLSLFDIKLQDSTNKIFTTSNFPTGFEDIGDDQHYIVIEKVFAIDTHGAIQVANERVSRLHDLFRLFNHKATYEIEGHGIAEQLCCSGVIKSIQTRVNRMQFIKDNKPEEAARKLRQFTDNLNLQKGPDNNKFFRVIDFHGMSLDSQIVENQILNLWTSFETIVPINPKRTNILNVVSGVHPFIGIQYIRRIFRCLTLDILRFNRRALKQPMSSVSFQEEYDLVDKVCYIVISAIIYFKKVGDSGICLKDRPAL